MVVWDCWFEYWIYLIFEGIVVFVWDISVWYWVEVKFEEVM